jgi:hypothetical protein
VFAGLIKQAKLAASDLVLQYLARASVAVPFIIALGFALAAITVMLVEHFGQVMAYWMTAGGLAIIGIVAAAVVSVKEQEEEEAENAAQVADTGEGLSEATAQAMVQTPIALLGALFSLPGGPASALGIARVLGRNFPLVLLLVMIGVLFWPSEGAGSPDEQVDTARKPDGADDHPPSALRH